MVKWSTARLGAALLLSWALHRLRNIQALEPRRPETFPAGIPPTRKHRASRLSFFRMASVTPMWKTGLSASSVELRPKLTLEINYVGTAGRNLFRAEDVNRVPGGRLPQGTCVTDNFGRRLCSQINTNTAANGLEINPLGVLNPNYGVCGSGRIRPARFITACRSR